MMPFRVSGGGGFCFSAGAGGRLPDGAVVACTLEASDPGDWVVLRDCGFGIVWGF